MSHIESIQTRITDLESLKAACKRMGVEFHENQTSYKWYGRSVGGQVPAGFKVEDLGKCSHVIKVPGVNYEVGVVKARDASGAEIPGYTMLYDFWGSGSTHDGEKLRAKFGVGLTHLIDAYSIEAIKRKARLAGYTSRETQLPNGKTKVVVGGIF